MNNGIRAIGAIRVVITVIIILTPKKMGPISPWDRPMPAIMRATSPRGIIPTPIRVLPRRLNPLNSAGKPEPNILDTIARAEITKPKATAFSSARTASSGRFDPVADQGFVAVQSSIKDSYIATDWRIRSMLAHSSVWCAIAASPGPSTTVGAPA